MKSGERIFTDIASIKEKKDGLKVNAKRHWRIVVNEKCTLKILDFYVTKSGMVELILEKIRKKKQCGMLVKYVCCDNAGEKKSLEESAKYRLEAQSRV